METETIGTKLVDLYIPGTMVRIGGIPGVQAKTGQYMNLFVIYRTTVEWVETDRLDITAGLLQTLTLLAIGPDGEELGFEPIAVDSYMYDIEVM